MNMTDPIADMLTRIRNAVAARHNRVSIPASKMKLAIARVLREEGYIKDIEILKDNPQGTIRITLRYVDKRPVLTQLKRVSKPGFQTAQQNDVALSVNQTAAYDFTLPVGSAEQTVTVAPTSRAIVPAKAMAPSSERAVGTRRKARPRKRLASVA